MNIEIRIDPSIRAVPEADWDALDGIDDAPFLRHVWLDTLERTGCVGEGTGWAPHHLTFWQEGKLVAAAPCYLKGNSEGEFVFDHGWANAAHRAGIPYYPKLLVAVPFTPANGHRLLVARPEDRPRLLPVLAEALRKIVASEKLSSAHVLFLTEPEAKVLASAGLCHRLGIQFHWHNHGYATFEDFLSRFSSKRRNQIRRERKEMGKQGIEIQTERGAFSPALIDDVYAFYASTVDKFVWGRHYLNRAFFEEICQKLAGHLEIVVAREGKKAIAGAFNIAGKRTLYGRYWGAREERPFLHFNVCFYHSIDECIARGYERFEPGAGGEHKMVRGFEPTLTHSVHHLVHPGLDRAVRDYLEREREAHLESARMGEMAFR
ncbi:MAG: GNAT family N-acetyltransferase [Byssovorax sp.]